MREFINYCHLQQTIKTEESRHITVSALFVFDVNASDMRLSLAKVIRCIRPRLRAIPCLFAVS